MIYKGKLKTFHDLTLILSNTPGSIVLTTGVYDVAHNGHTRYLRTAKEMGTILVVGLHSDDLTKSRKGENPKRTQLERAEMLSCFDFVDFIFILNTQMEVYNAIGELKPNTLVVSETTEDNANCPSTMLQLYGNRFSVKVLPAQSGEHSSQYIKK